MDCCRSVDFAPDGGDLFFERQIRCVERMHLNRARCGSDDLVRQIERAVERDLEMFQDRLASITRQLEELRAQKAKSSFVDILGIGERDLAAMEADALQSLRDAGWAAVYRAAIQRVAPGAEVTFSTAPRTPKIAARRSRRRMVQCSPCN